MSESGRNEKEHEDVLADAYDDDDTNTQKDKYLTFCLGNEDYGIEIRNVTEIIGVQRITQVPDMPDFIQGVINLRGKVIPVMDVRTRFHMPFQAYGDRTCIIVVDMRDAAVGLAVDEVKEVLDIPPDQVEPPPRSSGNTHRYVKGMGKVGEEVKILLDVDRILFDDEINAVAGVLDQAA